ncbi:phosphotriesterase-related protein-like [Argonauta hians]
MPEKGLIQTVLGPLQPASLGRTLCHEHLHINSGPLGIEPDPCSYHQAKVDEPIQMDTLGWIRQYPYFHKENLSTVDESEAVIEEMKYYKANGGSSIVDNTVTGLEPDVEFLKHVSQQSGVNIIAGTGFYVDITHSDDTRKASAEHLTSVMVNDILNGVGTTGIKCGVIGEIGCTWPLTDGERKVLKASGMAQEATGCPMIIHPGRSPKAPQEIMRVVTEAGARADHIVMSHLDRTFLEKELLLQFASDCKCYCEFDLFGIETSHYQQEVHTDMPSDAQRIQRVGWLLEGGYSDRVTISHDIHTKHRLMKYGGHGFSHILLNILPMMRTRGFTENDINSMLVVNPRNWLVFK